MNAPTSKNRNSVTPRKSPVRRLDIQGLRAVAVLVVVAFHAGLPIPGGFVGVDMFFVISGFVITGMLHREWLETGTIRFRGFYWRRFKRLTPALGLVVTVTVIASFFLLSPLGPQQNTAAAGVGAMLMTANVVIARTTGGYFDVAASTNALLNTWSLSVEEQFYLAFPVVLLTAWLVARRFGGGRGIPLALVSLVAVISFLAAVLDSLGYRIPHFPDALLGFYSPLTRAWEFAAGALLLLALDRVTSVSRTLTSLAGISGVCLLLASFWFIGESTPFPGVATIGPVVGTLLVIFAGTDGDGLVPRGLAAYPLVGIGNVSYSWYLWHWPLIVFTAALLPGNETALLAVALMSIIPASISYYFVEQPLRIASGFSRTRLVRLTLFTLVPSIAVSLLLLMGAQSGYGLERVRRLQATQALHLGNVRECIGTGVCFWGGPDREGPPVYLLGDSNADHFTEAVDIASADLGRPVVTSLGCRFVSEVLTVHLSSSVANQGACQEEVSSVLEWLRSQPPGVVILSSSDHYWTDSNTSGSFANWAAGMDADSVSSSADKKSAAFEVALMSTVKSLQSAGHTVVLVQTVPHFGAAPYQFEPALCTTWEILGDACKQSQPLGIEEEAQGLPRQAIEHVAAATGSTVLDLRDQFCQGQVCSTENGELLLYRDGHHISVQASIAFAPIFGVAISEASR